MVSSRTMYMTVPVKGDPDALARLDHLMGDPTTFHCWDETADLLHIRMDLTPEKIRKLAAHGIKFTTRCADGTFGYVNPEDGERVPPISRLEFPLVDSKGKPLHFPNFCCFFSNPRESPRKYAHLKYEQTYRHFDYIQQNNANYDLWGNNLL